MKIELIRWKDAYDQSGGWKSLKDVEEWADAEYLVTNVGFVVDETPEYIVLTSMKADVTDLEDPMIGGIVKIPKGTIYERRVLEEKPEMPPYMPEEFHPKPDHPNWEEDSLNIREEEITPIIPEQEDNFNDASGEDIREYLELLGTSVSIA